MNNIHPPRQTHGLFDNVYYAFDRLCYVNIYSNLWTVLPFNSTLRLDAPIISISLCRADASGYLSGYLSESAIESVGGK